MAEKKQKISPIRWDKDNWKYVKKIVRMYHRSPQYSLNRLINHLLRQHREMEAKDKHNTYYLKMDLLEMAKKKAELEERMKETQIILEAKREGLEAQKVRDRLEKHRSSQKTPQIALE